MNRNIKDFFWPAVLLLVGGALIASIMSSRGSPPRQAAQPEAVKQSGLQPAPTTPEQESSYLPVKITEPFAVTLADSP
jgi:hypothetical protein